MSVPVRADRTGSGKEHFEVLDGLRGAAAFLIVIFHLFNYSFGFDSPMSLVRHAYLAVDFFFALSGFVVAYAYDDRWTRMSIPQFYPEIWMAPLRLTVSFVLGLWLYRVHEQIRLPKFGLLVLSVVLALCFEMPGFPKAGVISLNGLFDASCVLFLFPLIILSGAHSNAGAGMIRLCKFSGRLSYPLYITHIPFVYVVAAFAGTKHPGTGVVLTWIFLALLFAIAVAWFALKFLDEPTRAWLARRYRIEQSTP